ncbi:hypothetical protein [Geomonas edaphica]|uniref:hypothetical protein n=1 Tax=Geomonas edaphica TaxID=2570226 RepID=UPI001FEA964E|nr:hypothetical protein [Geomonas edaphica]
MDVKMKFCSDCGAQIALKTEICPHCGVRQIHKSNKILKVCLIAICGVLLLGMSAVLITFFTISGEEKTKRVPLDEKHMPAYELFKKTQSKMEVDKGCPTCHFEPGGVPFPPKHPKAGDGPMRCLFCHKLKLV